MWQRWNGTSHIFEKSDDNGSTWAPLPLDASIINQGAIPDARLSANVAMRNAPNTFNGNIALNGALTLTSNIVSTGVYYPGRIDVAGQQTNWYFASHGGYGLYASTTLYIAGTLYTTADILALANIQVASRIQVGGASGLSNTIPAWRSTGSMMECVSGDNSQWMPVKALNLTTVGAGSSFNDLTIAAGFYGSSINCTGLIQGGSFSTGGTAYMGGQLNANGGITTTTIYTGSIDAGGGYTGRAGAGGGVGQPFELYWTGANMNVYVGAVYVGAMQMQSDARLKKNIEPIPHALDAINLLNPVSFEWRGVEDEKGIHYGLLAQEVKSEFPDIVRVTGKILDDDPDDLLRIDYQALIPLLIRAVQELSEKIDSLES